MLTQPLQQSFQPLADISLTGTLAEGHEAWQAIAILINDQAGVQWHLEVVSTKGGIQQHDIVIAILQQIGQHAVRGHAHDKLLGLLELR